MEGTTLLLAIHVSTQTRSTSRNLAVEGTFGIIMPIVERVDWVRLQLALGRKVHIMLSAARDDNKTKCKIIVYPLSKGPPSAFAGRILKSQLTWLRSLTSNFISVDRGHKAQ